MKLLNKLERKFGAYAIRNLTLYIIVTYLYHRLCTGICRRKPDCISLSGSVLYSARSDLETGQLASGTTLQPEYLYDHHAVFLLLHR